MPTAPEAATRAAIPRWWKAMEAAQATYDTLATDPTWSPPKFRPNFGRVHNRHNDD